MLLPRSRKASLCILLVPVIIFLVFRRFTAPDSILDDDPPDIPPSSTYHQQPPVVDEVFGIDTDSEPVPVQKPQQVPRKPQPPAIRKHKFRSDGLLHVNLEGAHPIFELISRAEKEWEAKLRSASKTFKEVVQEYKRRYKRAPPKGFDLW